MLDRASTFALPETAQLLKTQFVPVAIDQAYQRRQKDAEGEFYRKIAAQGPRDINRTTQGFYVSTPDGKLLLYNNNRDPMKLYRLLKDQLAEFKKLPTDQQSADSIASTNSDPRYNPQPPSGGLVVRVRSKVLSGYEETEDRWKKIFQSSVSRDNLWIRAAEVQSLLQSQMPPKLAKRIARFHLVDNTRGEPPMWRKQEVRAVEMKITDGTLTGSVDLRTNSDDRGYVASLQGRVESSGDKITRFDIVCSGEFWGEGRFTQNGPPGKFPLAISFSLADGTDVADAIPPQGSRGWLQGYMEP